MPKSKKPRKNKAVKITKNLDKMTAAEQIKHFYGDKVPYCKICGSDTERVNDTDLAWFKTQDTTYKLKFIFGPICNCYLEDDNWMDLR
tara:strand:- start:619 stop:882 length:264 start_codon:yes stop_codon:yes gene_type:complete